MRYPVLTGDASAQLLDARKGNTSSLSSYSATLRICDWAIAVSMLAIRVAVRPNEGSALRGM